MLFSDGRFPIGPTANPEDFIPGDFPVLTSRPDRSGPGEAPGNAAPVEHTMYHHPTKTLRIQFGGMAVDADIVNGWLRKALKLGEVEAIILYVSQDTLMSQRGWLEKQGYVQQMQTNYQSSQFVMEQRPAKKLED